MGIGLLNVLIYKIRPPKEKKSEIIPVSAADIIQGSKLTDAMKTGSPTICVFDNKTGLVPRTGTIYVSGNNIRTDYTVTNGKTGNSNGHLVSNGEYFYIWTEQNTGFKLQISAFPGQSATTSAENLLRAYTSMDTNSEIKCLPWETDMSVYKLPANVDFKDLTKTMLDLKNSIQTTGKP